MGVNHPPGSCPIERKSLWESNSHRSTGFFFQHTRASGELVRGVPAFILSVGILPAGPRSLALYLLGNETHKIGTIFQKQDCELLRDTLKVLIIGQLLLYNQDATVGEKI